MISIPKPILISKEHILSAAKTLTATFIDYPFWCYIFPKAATRKEKLFSTFTMLIRHGLRNGYVYSTSLNFEGIIIWLKSENIKTSLINYLRCGAFKCMRKIGLVSTKRLLEANDYINQLHQKNLPEPHSYLFIIGIHPEHQKKGYGTFLINDLLQSTENNNLLCYLETNTEENTEFFKRFGFKIVEKGIFPDSDVGNWCMVKRG